MASIAPAQQRRAMLIAGGGFVLVLALFVGSRLVGGGGGSETADPSAPSTPAPQTTPGTPPPGGGAPSRPAEVPVVAIPPVPEAFETSELRDPFTPPLAAIEFLRSLLPPSSGAPSPGDPDPGGPSPSPASIALRAITVVDGAEIATVDVGGTLYDAAEGDRLGPNDEYRVVTLDVSAQCGTFLFGDEAFSMCVGQAPQQPPAPGTTPQK